MALRECILKGDWGGALEASEGLKGSLENLLKLKYVILRQKYFELLEVCGIFLFCFVFC